MIEYSPFLNLRNIGIAYYNYLLKLQWSFSWRIMWMLNFNCSQLIVEFFLTIISRVLTWQTLWVHDDIFKMIFLHYLSLERKGSHFLTHSSKHYYIVSYTEIAFGSISMLKLNCGRSRKWSTSIQKWKSFKKVFYSWV